MSTLHALSSRKVTPRFIDLLMRTYLHFPVLYHSELERYYLKYWSPEYLKSQIHNGALEIDSITYNIIWHGCTPYSAAKSAQLALSMRCALPVYALPNYVVISIPKEPNHK